MRRRLQLAIALIVAVTAPVAALADVGTPLMWAGTLHLVVLNAVIGVLDGLILARWFGARRSRAVAWMIPANYFSMSVGVAMMRPAWSLLDRSLPGAAPLYKAPWILWILLAASWAVTVLLEWPFCVGALSKVRQGWRASLLASSVVQTASYALLVPFYVWVSVISLYRVADIRHDLAFVKPPIATVFYIDQRRGGMWRIRTDGTARSEVQDLRVRDPDTRLFIPPGRGEHPCEIRLAMHPDSPDARLVGANGVVLLRDLGSGCTTTPTRGSDAGTFVAFGEPADLRPLASQGLQVSTGEWPGEGISVTDAKGDGFTLALETPFKSWICRNATVLPNDQVVFQLGDDSHAQIVILDVRTRKLGFLAMGQGPVVVLHAR